MHHKQDKQTKDFERLHAFNLESSATRAKVALCALMAGRAQPAYELPRARSMQEKRVFEGLQVLVTKSPAGKMAEKDVSTLVQIGGGEVRSSRCALHHGIMHFFGSQVVSKETPDCVMVSDRAQKCKPTTKVRTSLRPMVALSAICVRI